MGFRVKQLSPETPPDSFPDPATAYLALGHPDGLLAIGGDLSPARLLAAYQRGIFPWFNADQPILWWSPDPRAVVFTDEFHMSRSLAKELRSGDWQVSINQCFAEVIRGCATDRGEHGTWITTEMIAAYERMHALGYAYSVESWYREEFAGGIYGLLIGNIFFGESMFSARQNGSKVAFSKLIAYCLERGIVAVDCQMSSAHLSSLGMREISRTSFLDLIGKHTLDVRPQPDFAEPRQAADSLALLRGHGR